MTQQRHKDIRTYIPFLFSDNLTKDSDPWWQVSKGIKEYNDNRSRTVLSSFLKVFDESMSAYKPQITKTGTLPHLSCILRKPEPLEHNSKLWPTRLPTRSSTWKFKRAEWKW
jgi:hypothetical protein